MKSSHMLSRLFPVLLGLAGLALAGCLETEYSLGRRDASVVDRAFCGDWMLSRKDEKGQTQNSHLVVRNLNDREYYVEWSDVNGKPEDRTRDIAFVADVKGVSFAHLQQLGEEGNNAEKFIIFRFGMEGEKLVIRELNDTFFKEQNLTSDEQLRKVVDENLENKQMYAGEPLVGTRQTR
jgi:hypothetical protein